MSVGYAERMGEAVTGERGLHEGRMTSAIEEQTAKIPSGVFMTAAIGSILLSLGLQLSGRREASNFVGQWAPTLLIIGMYNKLVKLHGH